MDLHPSPVVVKKREGEQLHTSALLSALGGEVICHGASHMGEGMAQSAPARALGMHRVPLGQIIVD